MKEKDGVIYKKVFSARPGELYFFWWEDGVKLSKKIEVLTDPKPKT